MKKKIPKIPKDPADRLWRLLDSFFTNFSARMEKLSLAQEKLSLAQEKLRADQEASFIKSQEEWKELKAFQRETNKQMKETDKQIKETNKQMKETDKQIKETNKQMKETDRKMKETDKQIKETNKQMKETDRKMKETDRKMKETDRKMKETDRKIKKIQDIFIGQWGKLMESLVEGGLVQAFNIWNIEVHYNLMNLKKEHGKHRFEFDIVSVNHSEVVVTEAKTVLKVKDVDLLIKKLNRFTDYIPEYKGKKIYGAVAFLRAHQSSARYAEKKGLFVIKAAGGNIPNIINKESFKPKCFS